MSIDIKNCHFNLNGTATGIHVKGSKVNMNIEDCSFENTKKDIHLQVGDDSNITISRIESIGDKMESISVEEYIYTIDDIIRQIDSLDFDEENKRNIIERLVTIQGQKDTGKAIKVIKEVYEIGKGIGLPILAQIICKSFGIS